MPAAKQEVDSSMGDADICPISLECGLVVPRRSIDVNRLQDDGLHGKPSAMGLSTSSSKAAGGVSKEQALAGIANQQQLDAISARRQLPGRSPAAPMSSETPAELLTPDGRLNMDAMMEHSGHGAASQYSLGLSRMGSFKFARAPSSKGGLVDAGKSPASAGGATSCKSEAAATSSSSKQQSQPSEQALQLALACQLRDARLLQQLLAAGVRVGAALDVDGNTALHLVLLPASNPAAVAAMHDSVRSHPGSIQHHTAALQAQPAPQQQQQASSTGGPLGWLTGCFTGSATSNSSSIVRSASYMQVLPHFQPLSPAAAACAQLTMVSALLAAGTDLNARNRERQTPVMLAARQLAAAASSSQVNAAVKVLELLCKGGQLGKPDLNLKDAAGRTALAHVLLPAVTAAAMDTSTVARAAAAAAGGSVRSEPGRAASAYQSAGYGGSFHAGTAADTSVSAKSAVVLGSAVTAPHASAAAAIAAARVRAVQLLVHHGADTNAADADGMTPLMHAAATPTVTKELLIKLLELGANARLLDNQRRSALTHAMIAQQLRLTPALGPAGERYRQQQQQQQRQSSCSCSHSNASAAAAAATAGCTPVPGYYYAAVGSKCSSPASASSVAVPECAACNSGAGSTSQHQQLQLVSSDGHSSRMQAGEGTLEAGNNNSSSANSSSSHDGGGKPVLLSSFSTNPLPLPNHSRCAFGM
jgi:ankyrin repeat protein